jgi:hypothetical protein
MLMSRESLSASAETRGMGRDLLSSMSEGVMSETERAEQPVLVMSEVKPGQPCLGRIVTERMATGRALYAVLVLWSIRRYRSCNDDATARRRRCDPQTRNERDRGVYIGSRGVEVV